MKFIQLNTPVPYQKYLMLQEKLRKSRKELILFLDHPKTITAGINFKKENLLLNENLLKENQTEIFYLNRGGDFTAHEPGQLVIYPHIDLKKRNLTLSSYLDFFIHSIQTSILEIWNLELNYNKENPGLYLKSNPNKKLVSLGIYFKSYFTSFGCAVNLSNSLETFQYINPCGDKSENIVSINMLRLNPEKRSELIKSIEEKWREKYIANS